jgi:hypothetical protein
MKERSIKELLQIMLKKQDYFGNGLCRWADNLYRNYFINYKERKIIRNYIDNNRPSMFSSIDAFKYRTDGYYWEPENIKPRIKWLKKHISKL